MPLLLLTPEQVAQALAIGRTERTELYSLLRSVRLTSVMLGGCRRIPLVCLEGFVSQPTSNVESEGRSLGVGPRVVPQGAPTLLRLPMWGN